MRLSAFKRLIASSTTASAVASAVLSAGAPAITSLTATFSPAAAPALSFALPVSATLVTTLAAVIIPSIAEARGPRILKFSGVPVALASSLRKKFPFVFEREVTLAEVDEIVRFLMKSGNFSTIEVVERDATSGGRELVLVASLLRRVQDINVTGNKLIDQDEIKRILGVQPGQPFERKNLLAAADELRLEYQRLGFHNTKVEIDFDLPNDNEVRINVSIEEGIPVKVSDVTIESPNTELAQRLSRLARSLKGKNLTDSVLGEYHKEVGEYLVENRYLTGRLSQPAVSYNPERTQARIVYTIENPWRFEFRLSGNRFFSDSRIIRALEAERLAGATTSPAPDMAERIRRLYQGEGFPNIEVEYKEDLNDKSFRQLIEFKITENPRVKIKKIEITGNVSRPESFYAQFIKSSSSDLIGSGYYNRRDIDEGAKRLIIELQNQGFLRAKITSQRAEYSKDRASVVISLNIDEGPLTQIRQIRFEGAEAFNRQSLLDLVKIKTGAALSLKDLEDSIQILKDFYHSQGYLEMRLLNENERNQIVTYNDTNTQATVEFRIYEGPRIIVGSIEVVGNSFTKEYVIKRELAFTEGDVLTPDTLSDSVNHLQSLGLFTRVNIRSPDDGTNKAARHIIIEVAEADPGLFTLGFGVNNERQLTFRGYLGISYRNLYGTGRGISFRVDPQYSTDPRISYLENRTTVSYIEPYIFGDRNRGRINIVRDQSFANTYTQEGDAVIQEENSVGLLVEKDLNRHLKVTLTTYNFANQLQFNRRTKETIQVQNIAKTGPLFELDYRDNPFFPSKGSYSTLNLEYSDPILGSSRDESITINFGKITAGFTHYQKLFNSQDFVWANSLRGGYLANLSDRTNAGVPAQEAFFLGGRTTIRGFDSSDLERIPNLQDLNKPELNQFRVTSDSHFYLLKTEIRFPIWRNFPILGPLGGAIFYDGGGVMVNQPDVTNADSWRDSAGFAFRIATPVGPINFDFAWKLDRRLIKSQQPSDIRESPFAFHFSIGSF